MTVASPPNPETERATAETRRPRILLVHAWQPDSIAGGNQRLAHVLNAAREIGDVTTFLPGTYPVRRWPWSRATGAADAADTFMARTFNYRRVRYPADAVARFQALRPQDFDVVILKPLGCVWRTGWVDRTRTIVDLDDVPSDQLRQRVDDPNPLLRAAKWGRYRWVRTAERRMLGEYRFVMVASEDAKVDLDHRNVTVVPNVFWPRPEMNEEPLPIERETTPILFVGSLFYTPNLRGLVWFVREVLPRVRAALPEVTLKVIGQTLGREGHGFSDWTWKDAPGVELVGAVPDVAPYIRDAQIEICPILDGGGTRIKILESLAFAKPVVSTTLGAYGHPMGDAEGLLRRDDPARFADACVALIRDGAHRRSLGLAGRRAVLEQYHPRVFQKRLETLVDTIVTEHGYASLPSHAQAGVGGI
jgi:polysaccharide biosynthesis protein PslH